MLEVTMYPLLTIVVLVLQRSIDAQFYRPCQDYEDCIFYNETLQNSSPFNDASVSFVCDQTESTGRCDCRSAVFLGDKPLWELKSTEECKLGLESDMCWCIIGSNGLCGFNIGLRLHCADGLECHDGRCRRHQDVHILPLGTLCLDTSQCLPGLRCQMTKWNYHYTESRCLSASSGAIQRSEYNNSYHPLF